MPPEQQPVQVSEDDPLRNPGTLDTGDPAPLLPQELPRESGSSLRPVPLPPADEG